ncbi:hypothetical protein LX32DRAFT_707206 [Colletotrichum zoysiae]|uniref:Uncharacterized protein n=1 Tax=Colletotrichum zoysiae TaxID=1216348 RepID=A0AAD9H991_9PEZI|nr:hypothetical protein LX32DRAFT_707206 [Colletotrichum zoysiae]
MVAPRPQKPAPADDEHNQSVLRPDRSSNSSTDDRDDDRDDDEAAINRQLRNDINQLKQSPVAETIDVVHQRLADISARYNVSHTHAEILRLLPSKIKAIIKLANQGQELQKTVFSVIRLWRITQSTLFDTFGHSTSERLCKALKALAKDHDANDPRPRRQMRN